jgi:hypothetical protein
MTEKEQEPDPNKDPARVTVMYWAKKGLSLRSMASKCGMTFERLYEIMNQEQKGIKPLMMVYEAGRAEYESSRLEIRDEILFNPETSNGLKAKILRDDLKEFEEHAPATRAIKIQVEDAASVLTFEPYTKEQEEQIKSQHNTDESTEED